MKPYFVRKNGVIRFWPMIGTGRERKPRIRAQSVFTKSVPVRVAFYRTPAFYYTDLMRHRRKRDMDKGYSKVANGIWRANYIMSMKEVLL